MFKADKQQRLVVVVGPVANRVSMLIAGDLVRRWTPKVLDKP